MKGEYYNFNDGALPRYVGTDRVFGVGNAVTGQGNIRASLAHSQEVTKKIIENYIGVTDGASASARFYAGAEAQGAAQAQAIRALVRVTPGLSDVEIAAIKQRIYILQERVGYSGDYDSWIASVTHPVTAGQEKFPTHLAQESTHQSLPSSAALDCAACH